MAYVSGPMGSCLSSWLMDCAGYDSILFGKLQLQKKHAFNCILSSSRVIIFCFIFEKARKRNLADDSFREPLFLKLSG